MDAAHDIHYTMFMYVETLSREKDTERKEIRCESVNILAYT